MPLDRRQVYRVTSDEDPGALIALDARVRGDQLTWFDSNRDRGHPVQSHCDDGDAVKFVTERGASYRFVPLTKEIYDRDVRSKVELSPEFDSTEAIRRFYLTEFLGLEPEQIDQEEK